MILVVLVPLSCLFTSYIALPPRRSVNPQATRRSAVRQPRSATVANKVTFREQLYKIVLAVTADATAIAHTSRSELLMDCRGWRRAGETREDRLSQGPERLGTGVELVWQGFARVCFKSQLGGDVIGCRLGFLGGLGDAVRALEGAVGRWRCCWRC